MITQEELEEFINEMIDKENKDEQRDDLQLS